MTEGTAVSGSYKTGFYLRAESEDERRYPAGGIGDSIRSGNRSVDVCLDEWTSESAISCIFMRAATLHEGLVFRAPQAAQYCTTQIIIWASLTKSRSSSYRKKKVGVNDVGLRRILLPSLTKRIPEVIYDLCLS